jgi:hypothetical protein
MRRFACAFRLSVQARDSAARLSARDPPGARGIVSASFLQETDFKVVEKISRRKFTMKSLPRVLASAALVLAGINSNAQTHPSRVPAVHPIPSAPTKVLVPASFSALPELQCKLYPAGSDASKALTVFTDDDGYARFHAVRATASDAVQRLALDCTNSAGKSYSYSVDLAADDTFAPRPLNLANERGIDRPALKGDPLSYSQSELIQAGYAPRPDPTDTGAYARWLEAAAAPGRMLEAKRSFSAAHTQPQVRSNTVAHANTVTKTTAPWWVGVSNDRCSELRVDRGQLHRPQSHSRWRRN